MEGATLPTPSQTVGPFFNIGLPGVDSELVPPGTADAIRLTGVVYDGEGEVVPDALLEIWQANRAGRYDHPDDERGDPPVEEGFRGFGRAETGEDGRFTFVTAKPGPVPGPDGAPQAPHILVAVFARGLLRRWRRGPTSGTRPMRTRPIRCCPPSKRTGGRRSSRRRRRKAYTASTSASRARARPSSSTSEWPRTTSSAGCSCPMGSAPRCQGAPGSRACSNSRPRWPGRRRRWAWCPPRRRRRSPPPRRRPTAYDPAVLGLEGRDSGNPAAPLVKALTAAVEGDAAGHVHRGATSQDVMDTAASLVSRRAAGLIEEELAAVAALLASLAGEHRGSVMAGRTLLQQALPTTFGLKAAGWLVAVLDARERLSAVPFAVQLGGAGGTLASLGDDGPKVLAALATDLDLDEPTVPWHTDRGRVGQLAAALALAAGAVEKVAQDIVLLAQTEVGEVAEASEGGRGGSSTLPHKRNPVGLGTRDRVRAQRPRRDRDPARGGGPGARARRRSLAGGVAGAERVAGAHGRRCRVAAHGARGPRGGSASACARTSMPPAA